MLKKAYQAALLHYNFASLSGVMILFRLAFVIVLSCCAWCQAEQFNCPAKIHRHKSVNNRVLVDKLGTLTFDDSSHSLKFTSRHDSFEAPYDAIVRVVFDISVHMRGGVWPAALAVAGAPGMIAGAAISGGRVHDYWMYLEYRNGENSARILLEVPKESSRQVINECTTRFGQKVVESDFPEKAESVNPDKLPGSKLKYTVVVDKVNHPTPDSKPEKATVVVVCPPLAARNSGRGNQFKLWANDIVVAVTKPGTYSFAYLDPGKYRLVSRTQNANGFEMEFKAGQTYYFLENSLQGAFKFATLLSRNSPELVTYLMNGAYYSEWKAK